MAEPVMFVTGYGEPDPDAANLDRRDIRERALEQAGHLVGRPYGGPENLEQIIAYAERFTAFILGEERITQQ